MQACSNALYKKTLCMFVRVFMYVCVLQMQLKKDESSGVFLNLSRDGDFLILGGRRFHSAGAQ